MDIRVPAATYLRIYLLSILSIVAYNMRRRCLKGSGQFKDAYALSAAGRNCKRSGRCSFICVFDMGIAGAGLATIFSQSMAAVLTIRCVCRLPKDYRLELRRVTIKPGMSKAIFKIGIPEAIRSMMITFANLMVQTQINIHGVNSMAAYASYTKAEGFLYLPQWAIGQANTTFVGQNLGAGTWNGRRKDTDSHFMVIGITIAISTAILVFPEQVFRLFSNDPEIIRLSAKIGCTTFGLYFLYGIVEVTAGAIRGSGHSTPPMAILMINMCGVRLIVLHLLLKYFDTIDKIILVFPITWICSSLSMLLYYRFGRWKTSALLDSKKL